MLRTSVTPVMIYCCHEIATSVASFPIGMQSNFVKSRSCKLPGVNFEFLKREREGGGKSEIRDHFLLIFKYKRVFFSLNYYMETK